MNEPQHLLDRLPTASLYSARSWLGGPVGAGIALAAAVSAGWSVIALCAAVAYSAGPVLAFLAASAIGLGTLGVVISAFKAVDAALTRAINKRDPLAAVADQFASIAENIATTLSQTLTEAFRSSGARHLPHTSAKIAKSSKQFFNGFR